MNHNVFLVITILLKCTTAFCQIDTIRVGDWRVEASEIQAYKVNWIAKEHFENSDTVSVLYRVDETIEIIHEESRNLIRFTQYWNDPSGKNMFTTVRTADSKTMGYVAFHTGSSPAGFSHLDFEGRHVTGFNVSAPHKKVKVIDAFIEESVFASFSGLLYAMVLKNINTSVFIPGFSFDGENPILNFEKLNILREQNISIANNEKRNSRVVMSSRRPSNTFWIDSNRAPYLLKVSSKRSNGSVLIFEIADYSLIK